MGHMPNSTHARGDGEQRSANDEFMDEWAHPDDDYGEPPPRQTPGLLPGALIGAGIASLCAIGIYLLAGGGSGGGDIGTSPQTVTETRLGPTQTVTRVASSDPANDSTFTRTTTVTPPPTTVTPPPTTVTVRLTQPAITQVVTATTTQTRTSTTTASAPPPETTTITQTVTQTIVPPTPPRSPGRS